MMFPIRCFTCGKPLAHLWEEFKKRVESGEEASKVLDDLGIKSYCCRAMFISHADVFKKIAVYRR